MNTAKVYELPAVGVHKVEIVSIKDVQAADFNGNPCTKVQFILLTEEKDSQGEYKTICHRVNKTYFEKSSLTKMLAVFGITEDIQKYELQQLKFATAQVVVQHKGTFASVSMFIPNSTKTLNAQERDERKKANAEMLRKNQAPTPASAVSAVYVSPFVATNDDIGF